MTPSASIVIPTRSRPQYLAVALRSIAPQLAEADAELIVVEDDAPAPATEALVHERGGRYIALGRPRGLNVARNTGVRESTGELVVFVDDDIEARPGWLAALTAAAREQPAVDVFTGPIRPRLEGHPLRGCGHDNPPITALLLGGVDTDARYAWGANMAIRRSALERLGPFEVGLENAGDEQEWQDRLRRAGGRPPRYLAAAAVEHRRSPEDARLPALARAARARGAAARRFDAWRGEAPSVRRELLTLGGCVGHVVRRRCPAGIVVAAHSSGRVSEALRARRPSRPSHRITPGGDDFLSGYSGTVGGLDGVRRAAVDRVVDAREALSGRRAALRFAARRSPPRRRVLVIGVARPERRELSEALARELRRSRHEVALHFARGGGAESRGKFENLNALLAEHPAAGHDWLVVIDDDIVLPGGFLDNFLFLAERFGLALAQPAHRLNSHAAWDVTRRRHGSAVRETAFVEIGPVTAFAAVTFPVLLPFPPLRMGWGLDVHWAAIAREHGWRCGVIDAVAIAHRLAPAADAYARDAAIAEARDFLAQRPYLAAAEAGRTLATHRRW